MRGVMRPLLTSGNMPLFRTSVQPGTGIAYQVATVVTVIGALVYNPDRPRDRLQFAAHGYPCLPLYSCIGAYGNMSVSGWVQTLTGTKQRLETTAFPVTALASGGAVPRFKTQTSPRAL